MGCKCFFLCLETKIFPLFNLAEESSGKNYQRVGKDETYFTRLAITILVPQIKNIGNFNNTDNNADIEPSNGRQKVSSAPIETLTCKGNNETNQKILNAYLTDFIRCKYRTYAKQ